MHHAEQKRNTKRASEFSRTKGVGKNGWGWGWGWVGGKGEHVPDMLCESRISDLESQWRPGVLESRSLGLSEVGNGGGDGGGGGEHFVEVFLLFFLKINYPNSAKPLGCCLRLLGQLGSAGRLFRLCCSVAYSSR